MLDNYIWAGYMVDGRWVVAALGEDINMKQGLPLPRVSGDIHPARIIPLMRL